MEISKEEGRYLKGEAAPATSSVLISSSRYLNNPRFRDAFAQMGLKRDGHDLPPAYLVPEVNRAMAEEMDMEVIMAQIEADKARLPEFAAWLDERYLSDWNNADLGRCAEGTLGAMVRKFLNESGMDIDFMFKGEPANDYDFINKRRVQNHDIEHMITGLDPTPVGESALMVANTVACFNYFSPELAGSLSFNPMFLVSTTLMRTSCHYPAVVPAMLEGFARGYELGNKQKKPLFMQRWEDWIDVPVEEVRRHFAFEDGPAPGHWEWTHAASRG